MADRSHPTDLRAYEQLVGSWPDAVLVFDSDTQQYLFANEAAERLVGFERDEILALHPGDLSHPDDAREIPAVIELVEREGAVRRPWRAVHKDGTIIETEMTLTRWHLDGRVLSQGIFRVLADALPARTGTEPARTGTEPARTGTENEPDEHLQMLERTSLAVVALDRHGVVTFWNEGAVEQYGWPAHEVLGKPVLDLASNDEDRKCVELLMSHHTDRDKWVTRLTIRPRRDDPFEAMVTGSAIRSDDGELNGFLFVTAPLEATTRPSAPRMRRARVECAACGREVAGTMRRKYCSEKCRQWAYYHRHLDAQRARSRQRHERRRDDAADPAPVPEGAASPPDGRA